VAELEAALRRPLPGRAAQSVLAPRPRRDWPPGIDPAAVRHAGALLLLVPVDNRAHVVLTVRADTLERHSGQVALPGGAVEAGETLEQTALREAAEEIALPSGVARVLGPLTPVDIPVSGFLLHPYVAASLAPVELQPADGEVARIVHVALEELLDPTRLSSEERVHEGREITVPFFQAAGEYIWGATAMVLAEFLTLLGWTHGRWQAQDRWGDTSELR
jgi:8-oxo-dGTP pyrophosphatase MutT (NUDIX family)